MRNITGTSSYLEAERSHDGFDPEVVPHSRNEYPKWDYLLVLIWNHIASRAELSSAWPMI